MRKLMLIIGVVPLLSALPALPPAYAETKQAAPRVNPGAVVEEVRRLLRDNYVVVERRAALDAILAKGLASGRYSVDHPEELAARISEDLYAIASDKHLNIKHIPAEAEQLAAGPKAGAPSGPFFESMARRSNHGIRTLEVLPGNIRYMRYDSFVMANADSVAAIDQAMAFLRGGDAIIIDLRTNGGGSTEAVRRLASYFVPAGAKLITFHMRGDSEVSNADPAIPGGRITGIPVYVLTSNGSVSAAEEFVSHVAQFKFGTLVGETTAGAAYNNDLLPVTGGFVFSISTGRPELPDGSDWEGKGIAPNIAVPERQALDRALQAAHVALAQKAQGPQRTEHEWTAALYAARLAPPQSSSPLKAYVGRFGARVVELEGNVLTTQRENRPKTRLIALGGDLFAAEADPRVRFRFDMANGAATALLVERADGGGERLPRT